LNEIDLILRRNKKLASIRLKMLQSSHAASTGRVRPKGDGQAPQCGISSASLIATSMAVIASAAKQSRGRPLELWIASLRSS
jgi:hypothetical protein